MEVHQLRYVVAVADEGTFTAAAERLHVSQSGVSTQVARLERELGLSLFDRTRRAAVPTAAGRGVVERAREALRAIEAVTESAEEALGLVRGEVRAGAAAGLTWTAFFDGVAALHDRHPGIALMLREGRSDALMDDVAAGRLDLGLLAWAGDLRDDLTGWVAVEEDVVAVVPPGHPVAARDGLDPTELAEEPLVSMAPGTGARAALDLIARRERLHLPVTWEVSTPTSVRILVSRGLGVGILSTSTADAADDLVRVPIRSELARSRLGVVRRAGSRPSPAARALEAILHEHLAQPR